MIGARLRSAFDVKPAEVIAVAWAAVTFFAILAAYFVLRPIRDALVLDGDPAFIPWLWTATFVAMTAIAAPWGALVARWPRRQLVTWTYRAFAIQMLGFAALVDAGWRPHDVGKVFYVWVSVFNLFVVSVFWSVCADVARPDQGRRLFGPIAAGGTAGALAGPAVTRLLVEHVRPAALLLVAAVLLEIAVWCARALDRAARELGASRAATEPATEPAPLPAAAAGGAPPRPREPGVGGDALAGITRLVESPYLAGIATYALCASCLATFVYLRQAGIVKAELPDRATRTAFFAEVELWTGFATLAIQLLVTSVLLRWLGVGLVLAVLPLVQGGGVVALALVPTLAMATAVSAGGRAVTHALSRPGRELLFTAVSREDKYKAKNVIDTLVYRFGDFGSAWLHRGLVALGVALPMVAVPLAAAWAALAVALGVGHRRRAGK